MAIFNADVEQRVKGGRYNFSAVMSSGGVTMQFKPTQPKGQTTTFDDVPDGALTASSSGDIDLPECDFKAGITGDATFTLNRLPTQ